MEEVHSAAVEQPGRARNVGSSGGSGGGGGGSAGGQHHAGAVLGGAGGASASGGAPTEEKMAAVDHEATAAKILKCHGTRQREADEAEFDEAPRGASSSSSIIEDAAGTQSATIRFGGSASALTTMTRTDAETMTHTDAATGSEATVEDHRV